MRMADILLENVDPSDGGWVTDSGEIHSCDKLTCLHHSDIAERYFGPDEDDDDQDDYAEDYGYVEDADDMIDDAADSIADALNAGWIRFGSIGREAFVDIGQDPSPQAWRKLISILREFDGFDLYSVGDMTGMRSFPDLRSFRAEVARLASQALPSKFA